MSISPTATEMLFAIGAGDQVAAVDDQSNYPPEAPTHRALRRSSRTSRPSPTYDPDLVVGRTTPATSWTALETLGHPGVAQPAAVTLGDTYEQIDELGQATGNAEEAGRARVDDAGTRSTSGRGVGAGVRDAADLLPRARPDLLHRHLVDVHRERLLADRAAQHRRPGRRRGIGYPQLYAEFIVDADPDLIFLADTKCCDQSAGDRRRAAGLVAASRRSADGGGGRARRRHRVALGPEGRRLPGDRRRARRRHERGDRSLRPPPRTAAPASRSGRWAACARARGAAGPRGSRSARAAGCRSRSLLGAGRPPAVRRRRLGADRRQEAILWEIRMPRIVLGALVGGDPGAGGRRLSGGVPQPPRRPLSAGGRRPAPGSGRRWRSPTARARRRWPSSPSRWPRSPARGRGGRPRLGVGRSVGRRAQLDAP